MLITDTGPILAAAVARDPDHERVSKFIEGNDLPILVPDTILTEIAYMVGRELSAEAELAALESLVEEPFALVHVNDSDVRRACEIGRRYRDHPIGFTDASIVALAERLGIVDILTLDARHFSAIRPSHCPAFNLFP